MTVLQSLAIQASAHITVTIILVLAISYFASSLPSYFKPGLRNLPGPKLAPFTRLWKVYISVKGDAQVTYQAIHKKYGPIVRTGPNHVSIGDPAMIPEMFNAGSDFTKSEFYGSFALIFEGRVMENLFSARDPTYHKFLKSSVAPNYSFSSLVQLKPLFDECSALFIREMDKRAGTAIDLGSWVQWYAFDVIGQITFLQKFGFMEQGKDVNNIIDGTWTWMQYASTIGQIPELHKYLLGNVALSEFSDRISDANPIPLIIKMADDAIEKYDKEKPTGRRGDLLEYLRMKQDRDAEKMSEWDVMNHLLANLFAGSDTAAIGLRACFYYLVKHPRVHAKLVQELDDADARGLLSSPLTFAQGQALPYLQVTIKEALRLHPVIGFPLDRVVPASGAVLCNHPLPGGTVVGINAWVVQRDRSVYGEDADEYRPERWLEADEKELRGMQRAFLVFGMGMRMCIGKNIAVMEMTKLVGQVVREFEIEWAGEREGWTIHNHQFARQSGVVMRFKRRVAAEEK